MRGRLTIERTLSEVGGTLIEGPTKTEAGTRTISLPPFLRDLLASHVATYSDPKDPTARIFTGADGAPLRAGNFRKRHFSRAVAAVGIDPKLTPHDLRDTAATLAFAHGASVKEVQRLLGHKRASVTMDRYAGLLESMTARTDDRLDAAFRELNPAPAAVLRRFAASEVVPLSAGGS
jgi:integrase